MLRRLLALRTTAIASSVAVVLLWLGGRGCAVWRANPAPLVVGLADLGRVPDDDRWVRVTGGEWRLDAGATVGRARDVDAPRELAVPIVVPGAPEDGVVSLVARTRDPAMLALTTDLRSRIRAVRATETAAALAAQDPAYAAFVRAQGLVHDPAAARANLAAWLAEHRGALRPSREAEGMLVPAGEAWDGLAGGVPAAFASARVIRHGAAPAPAWSLAQLAAGALAALTALGSMAGAVRAGSRREPDRP